jgi:hypothetical protein
MHPTDCLALRAVSTNAVLGHVCGVRHRSVVIACKECVSALTDFLDLDLARCLLMRWCIICIHACHHYFAGYNEAHALNLSLAPRSDFFLEAGNLTDALVCRHFGDFVAGLSDCEVLVRSESVQLLTAAVLPYPNLVRQVLPNVAPKLLHLTKVDPTLIKTVDLGPFKHKQDGGLVCRRGAFELLEVCLFLKQLSVRKGVLS